MSRNLLTLRDVVRRGQLSTEAVAALVGVRGQTVDRWLAGKAKPSRLAQRNLAAAIDKIERNLGVPV